MFCVLVLVGALLILPQTAATMSSNRSATRAKIMKEIVDTEKVYVDSLSHLIDHYMLPLKQKAKEVGVCCAGHYCCSLIILGAGRMMECYLRMM